MGCHLAVLYNIYTEKKPGYSNTQKRTLKVTVVSEFQIRTKGSVKSTKPFGVCFLKKVAAMYR